MEQMTLGNAQSDAGWEGPQDDSWPLVPSRAAGLERLAAFLAKGGRLYQTHRNTDRGEVVTITYQCYRPTCGIG